MLRLLLGFVFAAAAVTGITMGTLAAFGDVESTVDNPFSAGELDLRVDLVDNGDPGLNTAGSFTQKDLVVGDLIFDVINAFPGDFAEATVSLHLQGAPGANKALASMVVFRDLDDDLTCNEPEQAAETGACAAGSPGELDNLSTLSVTYDYGSDGVAGGVDVNGDGLIGLDAGGSPEPVTDAEECNNTPDGGEERQIPPFDNAAFRVDPDIAPVGGPPIATALIDGNVSLAAAFAGMDPILSSTTYCIAIRWDFNNAGAGVFTDNMAQSDGFELDFDFIASQP